MLRSLRSAVLLASFAGSAAAQTATFKGRVLTDSLERPLPGVSVVIEALKLEVLSDSLGRFTMTGVTPGTHLVTVRRIGLSPLTTHVQFTANNTVDADLLMAVTAAQALPDVKVETKAPVTGKMAEFEERRLSGHGRFMTQQELESRNYGVLTSALRRIPGIEVQGRGRDQWISAGRMSQPGGALMRSNSLPCPVAVVLDGAFIYGTGEANEPKFAIDQINPSSLAGIEFYVGAATIPIKYNATRHTCGLLVLWTK